MPRILVIDDDQHFRYYLVTLLERAGYQTFSLQDGLRADALLEAEAVELRLQELRELPFVAGRVAGVDPDDVGEQPRDLGSFGGGQAARQQNRRHHANARPLYSGHGDAGSNDRTSKAA